MVFALTDKNIREKRLREADYSTAAGFDVKVFELSDFPYFENLQKGLMLSPNQLHCRTKAIYKALQKENLIEPDLFEYRDAEAVTNVMFATVRSNSESVRLSHTPFFRHFQLVQNRGFEQAHAPGSSLWWKINFSTGQSKQDIFPGLISENVPIYKMYRKRAAFIMVAEEISTKRHWSNKTRLPMDWLAIWPAEKFNTLMDGVHERRHLCQITFESSHIISDFYQELDAVLAERTALKSLNASSSYDEAITHARFVDMLGSSPEYWFAATMEDLEKGVEPQDFFKTARAICEIRFRMAMHIDENENKFQQTNSEDLQSAIGCWANHPQHEKRYYLGINDPIKDLSQKYGEIFGDLRKVNPQFTYTTLRQLVEQQAFSDPFAERLANRILTAASYFNPDLLYADHIPSRHLQAATLSSKAASMIQRFTKALHI